MNLIQHRGLNCYQTCMVSIADALGVAWLDAFATLWSETEFDEDARCPLYVTRRLYANMVAQGMEIEEQICTTSEEAAARLAAIPVGELFMVGMDLYDVPWSPVRGFGRGPHYFFARMDATDAACFDPTYGESGARMERGALATHANEIDRIRLTGATPPDIDPAREAQEILRIHPRLEQELQAEIEGCRGAGRNRIAPLIRQITALINNRRLFALFMQSRAEPSRSRFDEAFLARWEAAKNGLHKAAIVNDNERVLDEVRGLFKNLIREEIAIARELIASNDARMSS